MGYEVDFLPVGEGKSGGDAIALRYGNLHGRRDEQSIIVVDGGYRDDGEALVDHVQTYYGAGDIDLVVSTHPDADHVSGLKVILEELRIGELWMHLPGRQAEEMADLRARGWRTAEGLRENLQRSLEDSAELEDIAKVRGIPIREPFTGVCTNDERFLVMGPTESYYSQLLPEFRTYEGRSTLEAIVAALKGVVPETPWHETLTEDGETSPENNSSAITCLAVDGRVSVFTGDAGIPALSRATDALEARGFEPSMLRFIDVPHHGSKRNVSPSVLDRLLGPKVQKAKSKTAFVSCPPDGAPKHPAKKVTNALNRRGSKVGKTAGSKIWHHYDAPDRPGWGPLNNVPFYPEVEE